MNKLLSSITLSFIVTGGLIAGEITGVVKYIGKPPKAKRLRMDADPVCAASHQEAAKLKLSLLMQMEISQMLLFILRV